MKLCALLLLLACAPAPASPRAWRLEIMKAFPKGPVNVALDPAATRTDLMLLRDSVAIRVVWTPPAARFDAVLLGVRYGGQTTVQRFEDSTRSHLWKAPLPRPGAPAIAYTACVLFLRGREQSRVHCIKSAWIERSGIRDAEPTFRPKGSTPI